MATGIDVLASALPGVGTAATVANLGLALTGNPTIGESVVDYVGRHPNQYEPGQTATRPGGGGRNEDQDLRGGVPPKQKKKKKKTFEEKYLETATSDVWRPTPTQKWVTETEIYGDYR